MRQLFCFVISVLMFGCSAGDQLVESFGMSNKATVLKIDLSLDASSLKEGRLVVIASVINQSNSPLSLLKFNTPFDRSVLGNIFTVKQISNQEILGYQGRMAKRMAPSAKDYLKIGPGENIKSQLDISQSYNFCVNRQYSLSFSRDIFDDFGAALEYTVNAHDFIVNGDGKKC